MSGNIYLDWLIDRMKHLRTDSDYTIMLAEERWILLVHKYNEYSGVLHIHELVPHDKQDGSSGYFVGKVTECRCGSKIPRNIFILHELLRDV